MGRKIDIKRIENATRRHVTYSKRRSSLMKKAHELSVFCDIDVLLIVFSPSRRVSSFCSRARVEDLLERYINLPTVKKHEKNPNIKNVAEKVERLKGIENITGDENKLHYLNNRINHLELQAKKSKSDLELLGAIIRDFEPPIEEEDEVAQATLCIRSLNISLQKVLDRKNVLLGNRPTLVNGQSSHGDFLNTYDDLSKMIETMDEDLLLAYNFGGVDLNMRRRNPNATRLITQLDPWLSPYSNKARERILEGASVPGVNPYTRISQSVPSMPPRAPPAPTPYYFPSPLQSQIPTMTNRYVLPPPHNQAPLQGPRNRPFPVPMTKNWITPSPPARYSQQQQGALENLFMSYSNWNNGEGSSQFQANPSDQGIPRSIDFTFQPNPTPAPNQQIYKNQNNVVGASTSQIQANPSDNLNCFIGNNWNFSLPLDTNPRIPSPARNEPLVITSALTASNNDDSLLVFNVNDNSSDLIQEILAQHQPCRNNVDEYSRKVANVNDITDGHVGDLLVQHQLEDDGDGNKNSNEISVENENNPSINIDDILAIQNFQTEIMSLDALFEEIEKMAASNEGNKDSGVALPESSNTNDFGFIN